MCASNAARRSTITSAALGPAMNAPRVARYATGTTRGSAYLVVTVSWNSRSKARYGANAARSVTRAGRAVRANAPAPAAERTRTIAATIGIAHGATNALSSAATSWRGVGDVHSM